MKQFLDFLSLMVFFIFYKLYDIYLASCALIVATLLVLIFTWMKYRKVDKISLLSFIIVLIFCTLTLIFHNDLFIKWKVTVVYFLFALSLLISQFVLKKPIIYCMLSKQLVLPKRILNNLICAWSIFCLACSAVNIYVAFWTSQSTWINFKVFGLTALTLIFAMMSVLYIYPYIKKEKK